ncbi:sister chromatid cohesion 1 protein 2 [Senna tora]|uniref:Sister chromatid cohesion 1 protein 2 n=1 Tax=Senna tora TaxID=362788 RepID=A0A834SG74_9FABA|nr:sister chromatid cohesion 1 protein 2 [Senna tora]
MVFSSKCPLSSKSTIWIAAYFFKRLKKAQIKETDISSCVDKILQDDTNFNSYRVLAYLLLGVVRIYSKKVEYLSHDCDEVLIKIKNFTINTRNKSNMETLRMSITLPDRFELDAFNLDIVEDTCERNIASKEEITLKDVSWKDEGFGQLSLDKCQEFDFCQNTCFPDQHVLEGVHQSEMMDYNFELSLPNSLLNLQAGEEKFQESLFSQEESASFETIFVVEGAKPVDLFSQDRKINKEQTILEAPSDEDEIPEEGSVKKILLSEIPQEKHVDIGMFSQREEEPMVSVERLNESHQVGEEQIKAKETENLECQMQQEIGEVHIARNSLESMKRLLSDNSNKNQYMDLDGSSIPKDNIGKLIAGSVEKHDNKGKEISTEDEKFDEEQITAKETTNTECQMLKEIGEVHEARNSPPSMERFQGDKSNEKECMDHDRSSVDEKKIEKLIEGSVEKNHNKSISKLQEKNSIEDEQFHVIPPESKGLDITPQTKFPGGSVAKLKAGATMAESMLISTPAVRERTHFSRKRKCVFDRLIVLPNEVLRQSIYDASDLISKRRKSRCPRLAAWRASRIYRLPEGFYESLLPCYSLDLQILFSKKKIKISKYIETVETPGKLDESESQTVDDLVPNEPVPATPPQCSKIRSTEYQESPQNSDNVNPSSLHEVIEREKSLEKDEELHLMKECDEATSISYETMRSERCLRKDEELNLMNEEINSLETENSDLRGWSGRTMKVARFLHRNFLELRKQREEEVVKFSQILEGRAEKECARIFYEILVLRTTSCVDVKQNNAYGDISVWRLPKLDQTFGVDRL